MADTSTVKLTNTGRSPRGGLDANRRPFTVRPGETLEVELDNGYAKRLNERAARGGTLKAAGHLSKDDKERAKQAQQGPLGPPPPASSDKSKDIKAAEKQAQKDAGEQARQQAGQGGQGGQGAGGNKTQS